MPDIDFSSEQAHIWESQIRAMRKGGMEHKIYHRAAISQEERETARIVNAHAARVVSGWRAPDENVLQYPQETTCAHCGKRLTKHKRIWREIYRPDGKITLYRCQDC